MVFGTWGYHFSWKSRWPECKCGPRVVVVVLMAAFSLAAFVHKAQGAALHFPGNLSSGEIIYRLSWSFSSDGSAQREEVHEGGVLGAVVCGRSFVVASYAPKWRSKRRWGLGGCGLAPPSQDAGVTGCGVRENHPKGAHEGSGPAGMSWAPQGSLAVAGGEVVLQSAGVG